MTVEARKLALVQKLLQVREESLLQKVDDLLSEELIVAYTTDGKPLTREAYNARLQLAESQIERGEVVTQEALEEEVKNW